MIRERSEDQEFHWRDEEQNQNHQHRRVADVTVKQHTQEAELLSAKFSVKNYFNEQSVKFNYSSIDFSPVHTTRNPPMNRKESTAMTWKLKTIE